MKRAGFRGTALVGALCLSLLGTARADVHVLTIDSARWKAETKVAADSGDVEMRASDCTQFAAYTLRLKSGESAALSNFNANLCNPPAPFAGTSLGVVTLRVASGSPRVWTDAAYKDENGNFNTVTIPALPDSLAAGPDHYNFFGAENDADRKRATQIVLITDGGNDARARLDVFDEHNTLASSKIVTVSRWLVETLDQPLRIGRVEVRTLLPNIGPSSTGSLYVLLLDFDTRGGAPRVELPTRSSS